MKRFKKFLAMMLALVMALSMLPVSAFAADNAAFTVSSAEGKAGEEVTVSVDVSENPGFWMAQWTVSYDTTRLEKVEYTLATIDGVDLSNQNNNFLWENDDNADIQYAGKVLDLKFKIREDAPAGDAEVKITNLLACNFAEEEVKFDVVAGKITVEEKLETLIPFTKANHTDSGEAIHTNLAGVLGLKVEGIKMTNWTEWQQGGNYLEQGITIYVDPASKDDAATLSLSLAEGQTGSGPLIDNPATATVQLADGVGSYTASYISVGTGAMATMLHIPITFKLACTEHSFADAICNAPRTCTECGITEGEADPNAHNYVDGVCSYCGDTQAATTYEVKIYGMSNDAYYVVTGKDENGFDVLGDKLVSTQGTDGDYRTVTVPADVTRIGYSDAEGYVAGINVSPENAEASIDYVEFSIKNPDGTACTNAAVTVEDSDGYKQRPFDYEWEGMWSISAVIGEAYTITVTAPGCETAVVEKTIASSANYYQSFDITLEEEVQEPEQPTVDGYTVTMPADTTAVAGETVSIPVVVGNKDVSTYNAFDMSFTYDAAKLELTSTEINGMTVEAGEGTVQVLRYGDDLNVGSAAFTLTFKAIGTGEATVTATSAKVGVAANATELDAADATILDDATVITISGYSVTLPDDFSGDSVVAPGADYTFTAKDKNYNYTVSATMGGAATTVKDNGDCTFTIEDVSGNLVITSTKEGKTFDVTLGEDMTAASTQAQYMTAYTATLTKVDGYTYDLKVTIGGNDYTGFEYNEETGVVTIPGADITGAIVFNSHKTQVQASEYTVSFEGNGAGDAVGENKVAAGADYSFTLNKAEGCTYTVSYKMGDSTESVALTEADGKYTIAQVSGNLVITVEKESDLAVEVNEYVKLNDKSVFLVTATQTLPEGKSLSYGGTVMFYSEQYEAWAYLVIVEQNETFDADTAKDALTVTETAFTTLSATCDVNKSGRVDINDAQLVYDLYNGGYQDFTQVTMEKFLLADTAQGDSAKKLNVNDAAAIVSEILK